MLETLYKELDQMYLEELRYPSEILVDSKTWEALIDDMLNIGQRHAPHPKDQNPVDQLFVTFNGVTIPIRKDFKWSFRYS